MKKLTFLLLLVNQVTLAQEVPVPKGLQAKYVESDTANYIQLTWESRDAVDELTVGYNVLVNFPPEDRLVVLGAAGLVFKNEYYFKVQSTYSTKYRFAIMGVNNFPTVRRSTMSEIVEIITPSVSLPNIEIEELRLRGEQIVLKWSYPDNIADLKGFRVYANNELFVDEEEIDRNTHRLFFAFKEKQDYVFQISAVTNSGLESRLSQKRFINIE